MITVGELRDRLAALDPDLMLAFKDVRFDPETNNYRHYLIADLNITPVEITRGCQRAIEVDCGCPDGVRTVLGGENLPPGHTAQCVVLSA
jgi:hypothetical protein